MPKQKKAAQNWWDDPVDSIVHGQGAIGNVHLAPTRVEARGRHALPLIGVRVCYTVAASFDQSISVYTGPFTYRAVLLYLMEYIVSIGMVSMGIVERNIGLESSSMHGAAHEDDGSELQTSGKIACWMFDEGQATGSFR